MFVAGSVVIDQGWFGLLVLQAHPSHDI